MYDITKTALTRAWRTGFGTIVRREDIPSSGRYPDDLRRARPRNGQRRLPFGRWNEEREF